MKIDKERQQNEKNYRLGYLMNLIFRNIGA